MTETSQETNQPNWNFRNVGVDTDDLRCDNFYSDSIFGGHKLSSVKGSLPRILLGARSSGFLYEGGSSVGRPAADTRRSRQVSRPTISKLKKDPKNSSLSERGGLIDKVKNLPASKFEAVAAFAEAVSIDNLQFCEPKVITPLGDSEGFRKFVVQNLWENRADRGWEKGSDVFEFIRLTYADYLGNGLARSSWSNLDRPLLAAINKKSWEHRKAKKFMPSGVPSDLDLPLKPEPKSFDLQDRMYVEMIRIHDAVRRVRVGEQRKQKPKAPPNTLSLPTVAPALWSERTTGREVSPAGWIKKYYGRWIGVEGGLTRRMIADLDFPLSQAYAQWIRRHPEDNFFGPQKKYRRYADVEEAAKAKRAQSQAASKKYRESRL